MNENPTNITSPEAGLLHHLEINVNNLSESKAFWTWFLQKLGYVKFQDWPQGFSYKLGPTYLVFVQTETAYLDPPYHRKRTGLNHLAFHADSKKMVDEFVLELEERKIKLLYSERTPYAGGPSHYAVFFEDPNRIKVEIVAPAS